MYVCDTDHFPLVITRISGAVSEDDCQQMEATLRLTMARNAPYVGLYIARDAERPGAEMRRRLAAVAKAGDGQRCLANAIVVANSLMAGALRAIRWLKPAAYPERAFTSTNDALAWLTAMAAEAGLKLSAEGLAAGARLDPDSPR